MAREKRVVYEHAMILPWENSCCISVSELREHPDRLDDGRVSRERGVHRSNGTGHQANVPNTRAYLYHVPNELRIVSRVVRATTITTSRSRNFLPLSNLPSSILILPFSSILAIVLSGNEQTSKFSTDYSHPTFEQ